MKKSLEIHQGENTQYGCMESKANDSFNQCALDISSPETYICREISSSHRFLYKLTRIV